METTSDSKAEQSSNEAGSTSSLSHHADTRTITGGTPNINIVKPPLTADEEATLRGYRLSQLKKLVKKCRQKKISFSPKFHTLQTRLSNSSQDLTDSDVAMFSVECIEALGSGVENSDSSNEYSSDENYSRQERRYPNHNYNFHSPL